MSRCSAGGLSWEEKSFNNQSLTQIKAAITRQSIILIFRRTFLNVPERS